MSLVFRRIPPPTFNGAARLKIQLHTRQFTVQRTLWKPPSSLPVFQVRHKSQTQRPKTKFTDIYFVGLRNFKWNGVNDFIHQVKESLRKDPIQTAAVLSMIFIMLFFLAKFGYDTSIRIRPEVSRYPPEIRRDLRKAIYFSDYNKNFKLALLHWESAFQKLRDSDIDVYTPEIIYLKVKFASWLAENGQPTIAAAVLEQVRKDNNRWMEELFVPGKERQRKEVLLANVRIANKLAELCTDDHVLDIDKAEQNLVYAVETILKEHKRREEEGVKAGEGEWISDDEFVAMLEQTAHHFEAKDDHYLAAPLFLQAISKLDPKNCHMAVLMNNLSISLAQQIVPETKGQKAIPRSTHISNAREWSLKALQIAAKIQPPDRTDECDIGCAVATHNLGEFAEMDGNIAEARKRYQEAKSLAKAIGFTEGVANADMGIERVSKKKA